MSGESIVITARDIARRLSAEAFLPCASVSIDCIRDILLTKEVGLYIRYFDRVGVSNYKFFPVPETAFEIVDVRVQMLGGRGLYAVIRYSRSDGIVEEARIVCVQAARTAIYCGPAPYRPGEVWSGGEKG